MAVFAGITGGIALVLGWIVTIRLFALARRSGRAPERLLATSFGGLFCVGFPLSAAGRIPALDTTTEGALLFTLGAIGIATGVAALGRFPYVVFRPGRLWARLLSAGIALGGVVAGAGIAWAATTAETPLVQRARIESWAVLLMTTICLAYLWNALESSEYYRRMRRRRALGLATADTTHRFLLWAVASWASAVPIAAISLMRSFGTPILTPLPISLIGCTTLVTSTCWWLAFFMPDAYRRRVLDPSDGEVAGPG